MDPPQEVSKTRPMFGLLHAPDLLVDVTIAVVGVEYVFRSAVVSDVVGGHQNADSDPSPRRAKADTETIAREAAR